MKCISVPKTNIQVTPKDLMPSHQPSQDSKKSLLSLIAQIKAEDKEKKEKSFEETPMKSQKEGPIVGPIALHNKHKKTLILDLDETLVHSSFQPIEKADIVLPVEIEGRTFYIYVLKRPGVEYFLERASRHYEMIVYTASLCKYADPLLNILDPKRHISYRLFRENCIAVNGGFIKDLLQLGRNMKDLMIVDNSPIAYSLQPENGIPIKTWIDDLNDKELFHLLPILEYLAHVPDVRRAIKKIGLSEGSSYSHALKVIEVIKNVGKVDNKPKYPHGMIPVQVVSHFNIQQFKIKEKRNRAQNYRLLLPQPTVSRTKSSLTNFCLHSPAGLTEAQNVGKSRKSVGYIFETPKAIHKKTLSQFNTMTPKVKVSGKYKDIPVGMFGENVNEVKKLYSTLAQKKGKGEVVRSTLTLFAKSPVNSFEKLHSKNGSWDSTFRPGTAKLSLQSHLKPIKELHSQAEKAQRVATAMNAKKGKICPGKPGFNIKVRVVKR